MKDSKVVIIGGKKYDRATGKPLGVVAQPKSNTSIKSTPVKKVDLANNPKSPNIKSFRSNAKQVVGRSMDIARSKSISRFSDRKTISKPTERSQGGNLDIRPTRHPMALKVDSKLKNKTATVNKTKTSKDIKNEAIAKAMKQADKKPIEKAKKTKKTIKIKKPVLITICSLVALVIVGLTTYIFMPSLSVCVASSQSKVDARFPTYIPDGYRIDGPASSDDSKVLIGFISTTSSNYFKLSQTNSSWDSSALKNYVNSTSNGEFITITFDGLTIFSYGTNAAWVNDGVLYKIYGTASLSSDQIRRIAISLCD